MRARMRQDRVGSGAHQPTHRHDIQVECACCIRHGSSASGGCLDPVQRGQQVGWVGRAAQQRDRIHIAWLV